MKTFILRGAILTTVFLAMVCWAMAIGDVFRTADAKQGPSPSRLIAKPFLEPTSPGNSQQVQQSQIPSTSLPGQDLTDNAQTGCTKTVFVSARDNSTALIMEIIRMAWPVTRSLERVWNGEAEGK